jgi:type I restriction enzyme S subunit
LPPLNEQKKIASYLDCETGKIDALIQKQEKLIELSEERKKQLSLDVLTLGLRKNFVTKESNLAWAPKIPSNWNLCALKRIANMQSGSSITAEQIEDVGLYPVFGGGGLRGYTSEYTHDGIYPLIGRQGALCGNINFSSNKFWASEHAVVVSPIKNIDPIWLGLLLRSMNLGQYSMSAAQPGLSVEVIKNLLAPIPPYEEQLEISIFLNKEYSKIDLLINKSKHSIELLKERRISLISSVVTGKIDVRGLA